MQYSANTKMGKKTVRSGPSRWDTKKAIDQAPNCVWAKARQGKAEWTARGKAAATAGMTCPRGRTNGMNRWGKVSANCEALLYNLGAVNEWMGWADEGDEEDNDALGAAKGQKVRGE